jgi:hypothetical protein
MTTSDVGMIGNLSLARLRLALGDAIAEMERHNNDYEHRTPAEIISEWRALIETSGEADGPSAHKRGETLKVGPFQLVEEAISHHANTRPGAMTLRYRVSSSEFDALLRRNRGCSIDRSTIPVTIRFGIGRHRIAVECADSQRVGEIEFVGVDGEHPSSPEQPVSPTGAESGIAVDTGPDSAPPRPLRLDELRQLVQLQLLRRALSAVYLNRTSSDIAAIALVNACVALSEVT